MTPTDNPLRRALEELTIAAEAMPRATIAGGGATTKHHFDIPAYAVWANDIAIKNAREALAAPQAQGADDWRAGVEAAAKVADTFDVLCINLRIPTPAASVKHVQECIAAAIRNLQPPVSVEATGAPQEQPGSPGRADETDRMLKIEDLIVDLQKISTQFGNTCVYIRRHGLSWGAVALNYRDDDKKNGAFDLNAEYDRRLIQHSEQVKRLIASRNNWMMCADKAEKELASLRQPAPLPASEIADLIHRLRQHDGYMGYLVDEAADAIEQLASEVEHLQRDCSELHQVIGTMAEHCPNPNDPAIIKALDNANDAANGGPRRHDDLLPFILPEPGPSEEVEQLREKLRHAEHQLANIIRTG